VGVGDESDGYAEAWYLPDAGNIPAGYATEGTWYNFFASKAATAHGVTWGSGFAIFQYPNANRASTVWYHDHVLGMTRLHHPRRSGWRRRRARQPIRYTSRAAGTGPQGERPISIQ
jgi:hypothetical protein